jgi:hypothetical protein
METASPRPSTSSSGRTGLNTWRTRRLPCALEPADAVDAVDSRWLLEPMLRNDDERPPPPMLKIDERHERRSASLSLSLACAPSGPGRVGVEGRDPEAAASAKEKGENGLGSVPAVE